MDELSKEIESRINAFPESERKKLLELAEKFLLLRHKPLPATLVADAHRWLEERTGLSVPINSTRALISAEPTAHVRLHERGAIIGDAVDALDRVAQHLVEHRPLR